MRRPRPAGLGAASAARQRGKNGDTDTRRAKTNLGLEPNIAGLLCYVPCCIGLIFSVVAAIVEKQSRFVRFHAFQSLLLHGVAIVLGSACRCSSSCSARWPRPRGGLALLVSSAWWSGWASSWSAIFLMIKANTGEESSSCR